MSGKVTAIILSAGSGSRMNASVTKQRLLISGRSVLYHTVKAFYACPDISDIIVVSRCDELDFAKEELSSFERVRIVVGGKTRIESAKHGFSEALKTDSDYVAIHDSARCLVTADIISKVVADAKKYGAATASTRMSDSIKDVDSEDFIISSRNRDSIRIIQTPQIFDKKLYKRAIELTDASDISITDDNAMLERIGVRVYCTETGRENIKLTVKEDLLYAEYVMKKRGV